MLNKEDYIDAHVSNLKILCGCCKKEIFITSYQNYNHGVNRCKTCSFKESRGEFKIKKFLEENNITFKKEYKFTNCRDKLPLPFDFYLPDYNTLIEFDGQQHYDTWFFKNLYNNPEEKLKELQKRDSIKTKYCEDNRIPLIRIPYWEEKNIVNILSEKLIS